MVESTVALAAGVMLGLPRHAAAGVDADALVNPELRAAAADIRALSAKLPPPSDATLGAIRKMNDSFAHPVLPIIPVSRRRIPGATGDPDVTVYVINAKPGSVRPAILHTHGGGYIAGSAKTSVGDLQAVAQALDCVVVTVEYRLAPETRWQGSIEDNYAGLRWLFHNAAALGADPARIALMGESAGGGHAALLAIAARDRGEVPVVLQVLVYPMLDDRTGSFHQAPPWIGTLVWTPAFNRYGWRSFLGQAPGTRSVPTAAVPARVADLSGLPPAFIGVGAIDLFVEEDTAYAGRLIDAGVATELHVVPGAFHAFDTIAPAASIVREFTSAKLDALRRAFGIPVHA